MGAHPIMYIFIKGQAFVISPNFTKISASTFKLRIISTSNSGGGTCEGRRSLIYPGPRRRYGELWLGDQEGPKGTHTGRTTGIQLAPLPLLLL